MPRKRTNEAAPQARPKLPKWIPDYFEDSANSLQTLLRILHVSERGIGVLRGMPRLFKALSPSPDSQEHVGWAKRLETAEMQAALAESEVAKDFPVLHGLAVVAFWSWLEQTVKEFLGLWLLHRRDALSGPMILKLRVRLGDYLQLQKADQSRYIVEQLEQELGSSLKQGVTRFESLLQPFGLDGPFPDDYKQSLFELQQVRNAIAHANGRVDRRLKVRCPWLKLRLNQSLNITGEMLRRYTDALWHYLVALLYRAGEVYKVDLRAKTTNHASSANEPIGTGEPVETPKT